MFHQCFISVSPIFLQCLTRVLPLSHQCLTNVSPLFHHCFTSFVPVFHNYQCTPVFRQCFNGVSPVFYLCCIKVITATRAYGGLVCVDICMYICLCVCMSDMSQMSSKYFIRQNNHGIRFYSTPKCLCNNWTVIGCEFVWWVMKIKLPVTKIIHDLPLFIRLIKVITISF